MADPVGQVHIAGTPIQVGARYRQRCSWCGALLHDYELDKIAWPEGQEMDESPLGDPAPAMWEVDALVRLTGIFPRCSTLVEPERDEEGGPEVPDDCCAALDDEVTE